MYSMHGAVEQRYRGRQRTLESLGRTLDAPLGFGGISS